MRNRRSETTSPEQEFPASRTSTWPSVETRATGAESPARRRILASVPALLGTAVLAASLWSAGADRAASVPKSGWPKNPTANQIRAKVGEYNWRKARQIAQCETGGRLNWYLDLKTGQPLGRYVSAMGMYVSTFAYGQKQTQYKGSNWQQQVAIAVAAHPITLGWSGWSCA